MQGKNQDHQPQNRKNLLSRNAHEPIGFTSKSWKPSKYRILWGLPASGPRYGTAGQCRFPGK